MLVKARTKTELLSTSKIKHNIFIFTVGLIDELKSKGGNFFYFQPSRCEAFGCGQKDDPFLKSFYWFFLYNITV